MLTVCTTYFKKPDAAPTALVRSCQRLGIRLEEFGTQNAHDTFLRTKLIPLHAFLGQVQTTHVMFIDGNDTFVLNDLDAISQTYEGLARGRVLIGSELQAWPYKSKAAQLEHLAHLKGTTSRYRFIDTGLIMGPTALVRQMLAVLIDSVEQYRKQYPAYSRRVLEDDVGLMVLNLCDGKVHPVIDYECRMICALRNLEDNKFLAIAGDLHCFETDSHPHIIHCNGHRRVDRLRLEKVYRCVTGDLLPAVKVAKEGYHK